ncbi:MAG TPA: hypothetical protein VND64_08465 [Pirellulales bacterium]|nr:hypothetical protein [Pirellulales bacterium]
MKKTILLLAALAGVAYYLHWFNFTTTGTGSNEHINITLDKTKIQQDEGKALHVLQAEEQRIQQDAAQAGQANGNQPANARESEYDPNQQSAGAGQVRSWKPGNKSSYDPNASSSGEPAFDPYDTSPPAGAGQPRIAPPRSAKRPPPSDLDRGFE